LPSRVWSAIKGVRDPLNPSIAPGGDLVPFHRAPFANYRKTQFARYVAAVVVVASNTVAEHMVCRTGCRRPGSGVFVPEHSYLRFLTSDRHRPEVVKRCARAADRMFFARTAYSDSLLQVHDHRRRGLCVSLPSFVIRSHHQPDVALIILNCSGQRV
jgi:hypothetical protein